MNIDPIEKIRLNKMLKHERKAYKRGVAIIAGIDEAGRGPLAGPVVVAACILPKGLMIPHVNDSKKLTAKQRAQLFLRLTEDPKIQYGVGIIDSEEIDRINIHQASIQAMILAVDKLTIRPECLFVDGLGLKHPELPIEKILKGDQHSLSIAAASIIAKETRDRLMVDYHEKWPEYAFDQHKGYGTEKHLLALSKYGPCPIHRRSFQPVQLTESRI